MSWACHKPTSYTVDRPPAMAAAALSMRYNWQAAGCRLPVSKEGVAHGLVATATPRKAPIHPGEPARRLRTHHRRHAGRRGTAPRPPRHHLRDLADLAGHR